MLRHLQDQHRVFDGAGFRQIARRVTGKRGRRHQIADVAHDEQVARIGRNQQIGHDAAVRTGDEQAIGRLALSQTVKRSA